MHAVVLLLCVFIPTLALAWQDTVKTRDIVIERSKNISFTRSGFDSDVAHFNLSQSIDAATRHGKKIADVLQEIPGVHLKNYGNGQLSSAAINGCAASQTALYWNGIKLNSPALGQNDLSLFTLVNASDILVARAGYNGSVGGSIFLQDPSETANMHELLLRYGSYQTLDLLSKSNYGFKNFSGATNISFNRSDNNFSFTNTVKEKQPRETQQHAKVQQWNLWQTIGYNFSDKINVTAQVWLTQSQREIPPVMTLTTSDQRQADESQRLLLQLFGHHKHLQFAFKTAYLRDGLRYTSAHANIDSRMTSDVVQNQFSLAASLRKFEINALLHYNYEQVNSSGYSSIKHRHLYGIFAFATYPFWKGSKIKLSSKQEFCNTEPLNFSPAVSVILPFRFAKSETNLAVSIEAARSYRLPSMNDLYWASGGNPNLKTERGWNGNLGLQISFKNWIQASFSNFYNFVNDWILWQPTPTGLWSPQNLKRVFSKGISLQINTQSRKDIATNKFVCSAYATYSFTHATNLYAQNESDQSGGKQLIYVPQHTATASGQLQYFRFHIRTVWQYTGMQYTSTDNAASLPAFHLTHAEIGKYLQLNKASIALAFRINNLLNTSYQVVALRPMMGRNYEATLRLNFAR